MKLTCNIDHRGRKARLRGGVVVGLCGVTLLVAGFFMDSPATTIVGIFIWFIGAFMLFEGLRGWCALRAMGFKTPM